MSTSLTRAKKPAITKKAANAASDHLHYLAFNNSLLANIITKSNDGKLINVNEAACRLLGYSRKELLELTRKDIFDTSESRFKKMDRQKNTEGYAKADITAIRKNGRKLPCEVTTVLFTGADGSKNSITTIMDMSRGILKQKNIDIKKDKEVAANIVLAQLKSDNRQVESKKWLRYMSVTSYDVVLDWDISTNHIYLGDSYEELFGYKVHNNFIRAEDWMQCIHPDKKESFEKNLSKAFGSRKKKWEDTFRFIRHDGSIANAASRGIIIRDAAGKAIRLVGAMQDITWQTELEEKLRLEISSTQIQIADAVADAHELERSDIGKELHDNVNQLLVASGLYLGMAKNKGLNTEMYLGNALACTKDAIEEIRILTKRLVTDIIKEFGLNEAIGKIITDTMEIHPVKISYAMGNFIEHAVKNKFKLNIFRIIQEHFNNIIKHARASVISISLAQNKKVIVLTITDDGAGFDTAQKQKGIGVSNIKSRAAFYKGAAVFVSEPGKGCVLTVTFPISESLLDQ